MCEEEEAGVEARRGSVGSGAVERSGRVDRTRRSGARRGRATKGGKESEKPLRDGRRSIWSEMEKYDFVRKDGEEREKDGRRETYHSADTSHHLGVNRG